MNHFLDDIREHKTEYLFSGSVGQVFGEQSALLAEGKVSVKDAALTVLNAYYKERKLKHSYASVKAATADYGKLAEAKELYEEGVDSEEIRQLTSWFKGMDKKWRFEIDDSKMQIKTDMPIPVNGIKLGRLIEHSALFEAYPFLKDWRVVKMSSATSRTVAGRTLTDEHIIELNSNYFTDSNKDERINKILADVTYQNISARIKEINTRYDELITPVNDELFDAVVHKDNTRIERTQKAYTELLEQRTKEIDAVMSEWKNTEDFKKIEAIRAEADRTNNLDMQYSEEIKDVLIHEIQHAIQDYEGLNSGSSVDYWINQRTSQLRAEKLYALENLRKYDTTEKYISEALLYYEARTDRIDYKNSDWVQALAKAYDDTVNKYFKDSSGKDYNEDATEAFFEYADAFEAYAEHQYAGNGVAQALRLYTNTAGEIEARDAASRKNLTEAERKNIRPDIDRKDVVFAENSGVGYSFRGYNADEIEVYETSEDIKNLPWTDKIKKFTDLINNDYAGRTARFERNGHIFYAEFDKDFAKKTLYGEKHFSPMGKKAFIRAGADGDVFDLVENASYTASAKDIKGHKKIDGYTDYFDYYIKTIQIDGKVFDLDVSVKKKYGEKSGFTYTLFLVDNKNIKASPAVNTQGALKMEADALYEKDIISEAESQEKNSYALSEAEDSEYMELAKEPEKNEERLNELVSKAARKAGYDSPKLYHGTSSFGFTKFDLTKMDDKRSIFLTDNPDVARSYGGTDEIRTVESRKNKQLPLRLL